MTVPRSREKSIQAFPPIFLQSCETKSGPESLGSRLGGSGVAGEGRVVGVPKFHSLGKCTIISTQIGCAMLLPACVLYLFILRESFKLCNVRTGKTQAQ